MVLKVGRKKAAKSKICKGLGQLYESKVVDKRKESIQ